LLSHLFDLTFHQPLHLLNSSTKQNIHKRYIIFSPLTLFHFTPVKSCGGMAPSRWRLTRGGRLAYDRCWAIVDERGAALTAKKCARLASITASVDETARTLTLTRTRKKETKNQSRTLGDADDDDDDDCNGGGGGSGSSGGGGGGGGGSGGGGSGGGGGGGSGGGVTSGSDTIVIPFDDGDDDDDVDGDGVGELRNKKCVSGANDGTGSHASVRVCNSTRAARHVGGRRAARWLSTALGRRVAGIVRVSDINDDDDDDDSGGGGGVAFGVTGAAPAESTQSPPTLPSTSSSLSPSKFSSSKSSPSSPSSPSSSSSPLKSSSKTSTARRKKGEFNSSEKGNFANDAPLLLVSRRSVAALNDALNTRGEAAVTAGTFIAYAHTYTCIHGRTQSFHYIGVSTLAFATKYALTFFICFVPLPYHTSEF
jgi:uncharacterized protein YcbX